MQNKVLIIAEAGVNHNGDINLAYKLVDVAKQAGADIVKFQTGVPRFVISKYAVKADYQKITTGNSGSQLEMVNDLAFSFDQYSMIKEYCDKIGITFLSTPFDIPSIDFLNSLNMPFWKIPSGEITNYPYLVKLANTNKEIIMSTGMSEVNEIDSAINVLKDNGAGKITLLHCNTEYPTPYQDVNLRAMLTLKNTFNVDVGYSDHTLGIEVPIAAVAMGASVIEKHFTLDRNMNGPDHKASLEPNELKQMVLSIRNIEKALGSEMKSVSASERKNINIARKSIIANCDIKKGELFTEDNLTTKRPGDGINPMRWNEVLGKVAKRDFKEDELIEL